MRAFLNAPSLTGGRSLEAMKQTQMIAVSSMDAALIEALRQKESAVSQGSAGVQISDENAPGSNADGNSAADSAQNEALAALQAKYAELEHSYAVLDQKGKDQEKALGALSSQGSEQSKAIADYVTEISDLKTANLNQQMTLNRRDTEIVSLRSGNDSRDQQIAAQNTNIAALRAQLDAANGKASDTASALADAQKQNADLVSQNNDLKSQFNDLQNQYNDLNQRMEAAVRAFQGQ